MVMVRLDWVSDACGAALRPVPEWPRRASSERNVPTFTVNKPDSH